MTEEKKAGEDMPLCFLARDEEKKERYTVIVEADGRQLGLVTDQVLGFREIEASGAVRLDRPIINSRNGYLKAAALTKNEMEENVLAYIIDIGKLRTAGEKGEHGAYSHKNR
ncbi:chemotaxis protein CheW [[Clostridium] scindens]|uniref:chemotaxis protein CheW n=1 Tax=Clostridium scindens (strain JCM 10418 / VPI 12708) TaxID=29347 RepID=UPI0026EFD951|nr:chemotaxis protein CheW [[Clostridium] scindens]